MLKEPVPVIGLAANFSPMPRIAPPPLGTDIAGIIEDFLITICLITGTIHVILKSFLRYPMVAIHSIISHLMKYQIFNKIIN